MAHSSPKKVPPSLGGGEVGSTAMALLNRIEFKGVPQPELIAECVVRVVKQKSDKCRSGLRGVISFYVRERKHPALVEFLRKVCRA